MTVQHDVLLRFSANWADSLEGMVRSVGGRVLRRQDAVATNVGHPAGLQNSVVILDALQEVTARSLLPELETFFEVGVARNAGTIHLFSAWPVPDLTQYGWVCVEQMPLMVRQPGGEAPLPPPGLEIAEVRTATDLHHFEQVMVLGFPVPELEGRSNGSVFGPTLLHDPRFRFWLGWCEGQAVAASASYVSHGLVNLIFLATMPRVRGRGFGSAMAWRATLTQRQMPSLVIASLDGQSLYSRMGYEHLRDMPLWIRERP